MARTMRNGSHDNWSKDHRAACGVSPRAACSGKAEEESMHKLAAAATAWNRAADVGRLESRSASTEDIALPAAAAGAASRPVAESSFTAACFCVQLAP